MYQIVKAEKLADKIFLMEIEAPRVARACQPGQFLIVKMDEVGERIPLTICDYNREKGTVTIVFQTVGASTEKMSWLREGDFFQDVTGPLGKASEWIEDDIEELKQKKILFVAGGVGTAPVYPQVKWLHEHGVAADVIVGAKNKELLILEKEMEAVAGNLYVTTDDGSYGRHGMVTAVILYFGRCRSTGDFYCKRIFILYYYMIYSVHGINLLCQNVFWAILLYKMDCIYALFIGFCKDIMIFGCD